MKKINGENNFLIGWLICIMLLLGSCNLGFIKETWSAFGNVTGQLTVPYTMSYFSNYPSELGLESEQRTESVVGKTYTIMVNVFNVDGYEFINWNTSVDGNGDVYNPNDSIPLEKNLTLYAQWKKVEVVKISYGDVNLDNVINESDYLLIEESISSGNSLDGQSLSNADVNVDGKVDLVDVDIIKQVCLGTEGYVDILPDKPVLIYEFYKGDFSGEIEEDDNIQNDDNGLEGGEESLGGNSSEDELSNGKVDSDNSVGSGNGSSGSESGASSGKKPSAGGSSNDGKKPSSGSGSNNNENEQDESLPQENLDEETLNNDKENEQDDLLEQENININETNDNNKTNVSKHSLYGGIVVFCIFLLSIRLIIYVICRFKKDK